MKLTSQKFAESDLRYQNMADEYKKFTDMLGEKYEITDEEYANLILTILVCGFRSLGISANDFRLVMDQVKHEYAKQELEQSKVKE